MTCCKNCRDVLYKGSCEWCWSVLLNSCRKDWSGVREEGMTGEGHKETRRQTWFERWVLEGVVKQAGV